MRSSLPLAFALALLPPRSAVDEPVPPPVGAGAHVASKLTNEMSIRFTAAGHLLRAVQQTVTEKTDVTIAVVEKLGDGLDAEELKKIAKEGLELETPRARPPFVRLVYGTCTASVEHGEPGSGTPLVNETTENEGRFFIERTAPARPEVERPKARFLYANSGAVRNDIEPRIWIDADAFVAGPRLAPLVLGKPLAADAALDVPPALVEPLLWQAVPDGKVMKATLRPAAASEGGADRLAFKIAVVIAWKGGEELPVSATFDLAGDLVLMKATGQVSQLTLSGPIQYSGTSDENGAKLEITGNGKLSFDYTAEPLPKQDRK